jgi:hypothetical protein
MANHPTKPANQSAKAMGWLFFVAAGPGASDVEITLSQTRRVLLQGMEPKHREPEIMIAMPECSAADSP